MIGVSPAYFLSKYGEDFSTEDVVSEVPILKRLGFDAFQLEITKREYLKDWNEKRLMKLNEVAESEHIEVSQVVAHFLIDDLSTTKGIEKGLENDQIDYLFFIVRHLPNCHQLTIPFGHFISTKEMSRKDYAKVVEQLVHSLEKLLDKGQQQGTYIALELQPGATIQGVTGFLQMLTLQNENPFLTYNFDTGHAHSMKEFVEGIPVRLGSRITGTHLCDNNSIENLSLTPGEGNINWEKVISELKKTHYSGSYDLEIICKKDEVKQKYEKGLTYIRRLLTD